MSGVWGRSPQPPKARGVGAQPPATENFCIFYLKKIIFSAFNCITYCNNVLCIMQTRNALACDNHFPVAHSGFGRGEGLQSNIKNTHSSTVFFLSKKGVQ